MGYDALTPAADIWAVGCIGFELYSGIRLFEARNAIDRFAATGELPETQQRIILSLREDQRRIFRILSGCLNPEPNNRFDVYRLLSEIGPAASPVA